jgi:tetratricopeptide (TPR) repeat protein
MTRAADLARAIGLHQAGALDQAEGLYRALIGDDPDDPDPRRLLGLIHLARNEVDAAVGQIARAAAGLPDSAPVHLSLGEALFRANRFAEAATALRRSVALDLAQPTAWHWLGRVLAILGDTAEAQACLRRCLLLEPAHVGALRDLADSGATDIIAPLRAVLARPDLGARDRIDAGFALAAVLDRADDPDQAFAALAEANRLLRQHMADAGQGFDAAALRAYVDARIARFTPDLLRTAGAGGCPSALPVFVVGMPRSGTTLVERMLASHKAIIGIGEGSAVGELAAEFDRLIAPDAERASAASADWAFTPSAEGVVVSDVARALGERHAAWLRMMAGSAARVVDKTPDNAFHLGAVACLLPRARIIICRRDPRDVCLSCHFQGFALPMPYTSDLGDCALRVQETNRMLSHWRAVLTQPMLEIEYESLVADPEREGRRMLDFLGLPWDPACLSFHQGPGAVTTASVWQVRRPVYGDSAGRWRRYARHLGPLLAAFGRDRPRRTGRERA